MGLVDKFGKPLSTDIVNKKAPPPKKGEAFGDWAGRDSQFVTMPGGGVVQFDLSKLTLEDYRAMRDHYQVNASLAVLMFMQHQSDWHIECEDKKIAEECERQLRNIWTPLNRSLSQANWAGYSPNALDWENNDQYGKVEITKVKDLYPEECEVNWKLVDGWAPPGRIPPKFKIYDGIRQIGAPWPIPVENSLWYPLLMENGDYYGKKMLRPAFTSWFFSILVHLFANRYYERFGEPTPIGRAPFDEDIEINGERVPGNTYMLNLLTQLRNRSVVVLPNDKTDNSHGNPEFDYDIEYLESQMRGADFERYMTRLDEEISIGLFTPILLLRTADVGSYNLGVGHTQTYSMMVDGMNDDRKQYIDKYILSKIIDYNFSPKAPRAKIVYRSRGNSQIEMVRELLVSLVAKDKIKPDIDELGKIAGMTFTEIRETTQAPTPDDPSEAGEEGGGAPGPDAPGGGGLGEGAEDGSAIATEIFNRVRPQIENAWNAGTFGPSLRVSMGYKRKLEMTLARAGVFAPINRASVFYNFMDNWFQDVLALGKDGFDSPESFLRLFKAVLNSQLTEVAGG